MTDPSPLTAEQIAELRRRLTDATPGEWFAEPVGRQAQVRIRAPHYTGGGERIADRIPRFEDAALIVAAVNALPALLALA